MAAYLDAWFEEAPDDVAGLARALGDIACAKGMSHVAKDAGLSRESLYRALSAEGNPSFATVLKVTKALGLRLHAKASAPLRAERLRSGSTRWCLPRRIFLLHARQHRRPEDLCPGDAAAVAGGGRPRLDLLLHSQSPDTLSTYAKQIAELREQEADNREQLLERVAYTWFHRLCALRYLDARGWHPFGCKVLMPAAEGETQPELLNRMRAGSLPAALKGHTNESRLHGLLDGQIQTAIAGADPQGEVYRELLLAS